MKPPLSDELRVRHVLDAIKEIESYLHNVSKEAFGVNFHLVWQIAQNDLPVLTRQFSEMLVGFEGG